MTRPLRGAALARTRNTRPVAPGPSPAGPAPSRDLPGDLRDLLHHPEVEVRPDERNCTVAIHLPPYLAQPLAALHPNPTQFLLAVHLAQAAEDDAVEVRRDLLGTEPRL